MILRAALIALGAALGLPAQATPPDTLDFQDQLFGISARNIYLLRSGSDNFGLYGTDKRSIALVTIDRVTGQETTLPAYRSFRFPDSDTGGTRSRIAPDDLPGRIDPFEILHRDNGAAIALTEPDSALLPIDRPDSGPLTIHREGAPPLHLDPGTLAPRTNQALSDFAAVMGDYQRMGTLSLTDLVGDPVFAPEECRLDHALQLRDSSADTPATLLHVSCGAPDLSDTTTALLLLAR